MFNRLRPLGRNSDKSKTDSKSGGGTAKAAPEGRAAPAQTSSPRAEPPRLVLPRHRVSTPKMAHLKSVEGVQASERGDPRGVALPGPRPDRRPMAQPVTQPVAKPVAQPAQPLNPARPVIPPYPVPGARGAGAEVQSLGRLMLVGPQIRLNGEIKSCERLVVEGVVEGQVSATERLEIPRGGYFHGTAKVESCLVDGIFEGELEVRGVLTLKANGQVKGTVRYGEIEIERGGVIAGTFGASAAGEAPPAQTLKPSGPRSA